MRYACLILVLVAGCSSVPHTEVIATGECSEAGKASVQVTAKIVITE